MTAGTGDPTAIRSIAVTAADVVAAHETNLTTGRRAVLRVTPPFSGRMRARLHVVDTTADDATPRSVHVEPASLLAEAAPSIPRAPETEAALREDPAESYSLDRHHEYHTERIADWRATIQDHLREAVTIDTPDGNHTVSVVVLGAD